jgi:hypothetical protein
MSRRKLVDKSLLLDWRKLILIPVAWIVCVILHNAVYGLLRPLFGQDWDEPVFLLLAVVVLPLYAATCVVYSIARWGLQLWSRSHSP